MRGDAFPFGSAVLNHTRGHQSVCHHGTDVSGKSWLTSARVLGPAPAHRATSTTKPNRRVLVAIGFPGKCAGQDGLDLGRRIHRRWAFHPSKRPFDNHSVENVPLIDDAEFHPRVKACRSARACGATIRAWFPVSSSPRPIGEIWKSEAGGTCNGGCPCCSAHTWTRGR